MGKREEGCGVIIGRGKDFRKASRRGAQDGVWW